MAEAAWINADAGAPEYNAQELRRIQAMFLFASTSDRFGARAGVRPTGQSIVDASGTTWTQRDLTAVIYPGLTSASGPYVGEKTEESGSFDPADGSNDRIDALDLQVRDDDEDASTFKDLRTVYVAGTPASSPAEPPLTANAVRLGTFDVPAGGTPSPSVRAQGALTVAAGGVLPLRDGEAKPTTGVTDGTYVDQDEALWRRTGTSWAPAASPNSPTVVSFTSSSTFSKGDYPWARRVRVRVQGGGGGGAGNNATNENAGGGGGAGWYAESWLDLDGLAASVTVTVGSGGAGGAHDADGSSGSGSSFGSHGTTSGGQAGFVSGTGGNATAGSGTGDLVAGGGAGGTGGAASNGGTGGASHLGGGGLGGRVNSAQSGGDAVGHGGGGGGGAGGSATNTGGDGSDGIVIVEVW